MTRGALFVFVAACSSPIEGPAEPKPTATIPSPSPQLDPVTSAEPAPAKEDEVTCLMWHVCGCNEGCAGIRVPKSQLQVGTKVTIVSGVQKGKEAFIESVPAEGGGNTLVVGRNPPDMAYPCALPKASPWLGYVCAATKSGPVPKNACAAGCGDP
jgi:hypothetical protein